MKRGSRKKQPQAAHQLQQPQLPVVMDHDNDYTLSRPKQQQQPPPRRQTNEEVAALTTKNYKLAKELADLRVRYRDESKNVTRLTMENVSAICLLA